MSQQEPEGGCCKPQAASEWVDLSQAGLPPPFAHPLIFSLEFWQGKLDLWSAVPAVGYSPALGARLWLSSSGCPAPCSGPLLSLQAGIPPAGLALGAVLTGLFCWFTACLCSAKTKARWPWAGVVVVSIKREMIAGFVLPLLGDGVGASGWCAPLPTSSRELKAGLKV